MEVSHNIGQVHLIASSELIVTGEKKNPAISFDFGHSSLFVPTLGGKVNMYVNSYVLITNPLERLK